MVGMRFVLAICACVCLILAGAYVGWSTHGTPLLGAVAGCGAFCAGGVLVLAAILLAQWWHPFVPVCESGRCRSEKDYKLEITGTDWRYRCRCGHKYQRVRDPKSGSVWFLRCSSDNSLQPYLMHTRFGRWRVDQSAGALE